jgi:hypothetical protein
MTKRNKHSLASVHTDAQARRWIRNFDRTVRELLKVTDGIIEDVKKQVSSNRRLKGA